MATVCLYIYIYIYIYAGGQVKLDMAIWIYTSVNLCIYMHRALVRSSAFLAHALLGFRICVAHAPLSVRARVHYKRWEVLEPVCMKSNGFSYQFEGFV